MMMIDYMACMMLVVLVAVYCAVSLCSLSAPNGAHTHYLFWVCVFMNVNVVC